MPIEIEAKMRLHDPAALEATLRGLDAEFRADILEVNTFFDTPDNDLKAADEGLRVRVERTDAGEQALITHKGPRTHGRLKSRSETQLEVADARDAGELLQALGYHPALTFEKRRRRWSIDGCLVELDTLPHLGEFVEIEGPTDEAVQALRDKLGLADAPLVPTSYIAMLRSHLLEHHLDQSYVPLTPQPATAD